ncbi:MAG TPA: dTDP-4-amino-4,6-dideoxygalactose transaminase [Acidimicrobiales bacterium]|nr:dTDP-4-amino-4,6-dideoxygalactose transaminase [Acidimicrobiales bacterium]
MTTPTDGAVEGTMRIPFNRPSLQGREIEYIRAAVERGHTSAEGPFSARAAGLLQEELGAHDILLTTSCTAALEMSALLLGVGPGDSVVVPSFGFVTTALAYARAGARILFCDIEERTLGLDPERLAEIVDDSVRAVVPIHYAGVGCDVEGIQRVLDGWPRAELVEDNAHGLYGRYRGRPLGSLGRFATLSFHETKNFICGEGGALVVNRADDVRRAHVVYHKGTNRREFLLGQVDKYTWHDMGSSFGLADVLAAYLYGQLEERDNILAKRRAAFERYRRLLEPHAERHGYTLPTIPPDREQAYHMFYVLLPDGETRDRVLAGMHARGVLATFHFVPLHDSPGGRRFAARDLPCPVSERIGARLLRLPFYTDITDAEAEQVIDAFLAALRSRTRAPGPPRPADAPAPPARR